MTCLKVQNIWLKRTAQKMARKDHTHTQANTQRKPQRNKTNKNPTTPKIPAYKKSDKLTCHLNFIFHIFGNVVHAELPTWISEHSWEKYFDTTDRNVKTLRGITNSKSLGRKCSSYILQTLYLTMECFFHRTDTLCFQSAILKSGNMIHWANLKYNEHKSVKSYNSPEI